MLKLRFVVSGVMALILCIQPCLAWSDCGHHIIAVLAFDLMKPREQQRLLELLQKHPRFVEDIQPRRRFSDQLGLAHWTIGRAAYWPDIAREQPEYNRPSWHYQLGSSLTMGQKVKIPATPGSLPIGSTLQTQELHIVQAIELCRQTLTSRSASDADKAVAICWIAHLVADAHQPCHAGSLYVDKIFPEGDRGATWIPTKQGKTLHAIWDDLMGVHYDASDISRRAAEIKNDAETQKLVVMEAKSLDPLQWLSESSECAKQFVYTPEILNAVEAAQRSGAFRVEQVELEESYLKAAGVVAKRRAAFASRRLADIMAEDLEH